MRLLAATTISRLCSTSSSSSNSSRRFVRYSSCRSEYSAVAADLSSHSAMPFDIVGGGGGGGSKQKPRLLSWTRALVPLALAASAGTFAVDLGVSPALCEPLLDHRYGGKVSMESKEVPQGFFDELRSIVLDNMTVDYDERYFHGKPQNSFHKAVNVPDVVVYPRSQDDVQKIVIACNKYKVPIVPYGGGTSIEGHTLAPSGGVCIDMTMMKNINELHIEDMDVVVEPGIGWIELNEYLKPYGLFFPLDPG